MVPIFNVKNVEVQLQKINVQACLRLQTHHGRQHYPLHLKGPGGQRVAVNPGPSREVTPQVSFFAAVHSVVTAIVTGKARGGRVAGVVWNVVRSLVGWWSYHRPSRGLVESQGYWSQHALGLITDRRGNRLSWGQVTGCRGVRSQVVGSWSQVVVGSGHRLSGASDSLIQI